MIRYIFNKRSKITENQRKYDFFHVKSFGVKINKLFLTYQINFLTSSWSVAQDLLGHLFVAQKNRAGGANGTYWVLFHTCSGLKNTFGIFGPLLFHLSSLETYYI